MLTKGWDKFKEKLPLQMSWNRTVIQAIQLVIQLANLQLLLMSQSLNCQGVYEANV